MKEGFWDVEKGCIRINEESVRVLNLRMGLRLGQSKALR